MQLQLSVPQTILLAGLILLLVVGLVSAILVARREFRLEQEAFSSHARLQAIFDAVVDAIITIDRDGRILQWSSGAESIFGYAADEIIGKDLTILMPEPHRSRHAGYVSAFLRTDRTKANPGKGRELTAVRKNGSEFSIELTVSPVRKGDEIFFTGILRDITERKRAEADLVRAREDAEAANLAKSQFLATMSHEIRTPMNGILGMAGLLTATSLNDRQQRLVENVSRSGQALLDIINDILDFAKIEAGKFELSAIPFNIHDATAELADSFAERCLKKGLEFIYFVAEDVPTQVIGDPARLRQVLVNLVGNAIKFTERGEILVEVSTAQREAGAVVVNFTVEDTGVGIPPDQCAKIFESFHQVDGTMTRSRGGSGLGLSITRQLVEMMGGWIAVESELGRGSRFTFTARFEVIQREKELTQELRHLPRSLRILLVDTNAVSAHVISLYLSSWHVDATIVSSVGEAEDAYRKAAARPFDVAILDVKGLGDGAIQFTKWARSQPGSFKVEFILLVGIDSFVADDSLESLDAAAILTKPVRASDLFNALVSIGSDDKQRNSTWRRARGGPKADLPKFGARVLVAEDNPVNQEVAVGILDTLGCTVVTAPNGRSAYRQFTEEKFDLVLMDCEMPIMNGIESTRRIREYETMLQGLPDKKVTRTPIVALTAHALNEVRDQCLAAGMDDFVVKPFDDQQMAAALLRWLKPRDLPATAVAPVAAEPKTAPAGQSGDMGLVVDLAVIESLRRLDRKGEPSRLGRTISRFADIAPPLVATIRDSYAQGDAEAVWKAAHSLKSSAGALGARSLAQHCAAIEKAGRALTLDQVGPLVAGLDADLAAAVQALQSLLGDSHVAA